MCSNEFTLSPGFDHTLISLDELCVVICVSQSGRGNGPLVPLREESEAG